MKLVPCKLWKLEHIEETVNLCSKQQLQAGTHVASMRSPRIAEAVI